ncbi:MAG TPA: Ig-like domain-containing protein, partial [Verrucomicrobiae bacterium]|nr:Ig-like domain-containing protein [Verrucomicrobiae bacterium]
MKRTELPLSGPALLCCLIALVVSLTAPRGFGQDVNTNAPTISTISGAGDKVQISFSLPVQLTTATNLGNYSLSNLYGTVGILAATPGTNNQTIRLATEHQLPFMQHWLTVNGVADAATGTNVIVANSQGTYTNIGFTTGYLKSDIYLGIGGTTLAALTNSSKFPDLPNRTTYLLYSYWFDQTVGANYGNRMSGILVPPASGSYTLVIYTPGIGLLSLSTNEEPAFKRAVATCDSQNFTPSVPIQLEAGHRYYIESLSKEATSPGDYAELVWSTPGFTNNWTLIPAENLGNYLSDSSATIRIRHQPADTTVYEARQATFAVDALGYSRISTNLNYQWQLNGVDIPGATEAAYTTPPLFETNSGAAYRVLTYLPGTAVFSTSAFLTVTQDLVPPTVVQTLNFGTTNIQLVFSEELDLSTATGPGNYFLSGAVITGVALDTSGTVVTLTTSPLTYGNSYSLVLNGIRDRALAPNTIASNTTVEFTLQSSMSQDIGNAALPATATSVPDGIDITASGRDIGGTSDQFNLNYQRCAGDFDVCVRVAGLSFSDVWAKAGLMARESLATGSRFAATL